LRRLTLHRSSFPARAILLALALACGFNAQSQSRSDLGFTSKVSPALVAQLAQKFTPAARELLTRWMDFATTQKSNPFIQRLEAAKGREAAVLQGVNDYLNRIPYLTDQSHWGQEDYWATPAESVASNGGDCEDYAIVKYYLLKELGVPLERLRITYVKSLKLNQAHMVLAYYPRPDAEPLILDNIESRIRPASERTDLVPVYSFNDDEVQIVQGGIKGKPSQIRQWLSVQERLLAQSRM
jgi:predicted transglutaminase-like cysteine proteinase